MKHRILKRRLARAIALGLAATAIAVPTAGAAIPDSGVPSDATTTLQPADLAARGVGVGLLPDEAAMRPADLTARGVGVGLLPDETPVRPADGPTRDAAVPPDDRPGRDAGVPPATPVTDGLGRPLIPEAGPQSIPVAVEAPSDGTDWVAVGIGAGAGLVLLLSGAAGAFLMRRRDSGKLARV